MCAAWREFATQAQLKIDRDCIVTAVGRCVPMYQRWRHTIVTVAVVTPLFLLPLQFARSATALKDQLLVRSVKAIPKDQLPARSVKAIPKDQLPVRSVKTIPKDQLPVRSVKAIPKDQLPARSVKTIPKDQLPVRSVKTIPKDQLPVRSVKAIGISALQPEPLRLPNTAIEPIGWNVLNGWEADDHAAAFATFLTSCRPLLRASVREGDQRPMYLGLTHVCRQALTVGYLTDDQARIFFEHNFRPLRITKLGDSAGLLTGYYEPIVDGSRFPTGIFKVPIYRRPPDLVPPRNSTGPGFPNKGQSLRRTPGGALVPYYDRGQILDGALDGKHLEICWIKDQSDALKIQIEGSARIRLEDGAVIRINYDSHNGYPFVPVSHILIERNIIPRKELSLERIRDWMHANPQGAEEVLRQNRSFVFFRIVGLSDNRAPKDARGAPHDREAVGAQGVPLTPGRSIAVDNALHLYGTPFFIQADLPLTGEKRSVSFDRLMIAQDTGSAIVGPARADIFWGAGDRAGQLANHVHHPGNFALLVPRELDPVTAGARMPLPPEKPSFVAQAKISTSEATSPTICGIGRTSSGPCVIPRPARPPILGRVAVRSR
jgi:membrane-bound lytic murein transglycosylase A